MQAQIEVQVSFESIYIMLIINFMILIVYIHLTITELLGYLVMSLMV